MSDKILKKLSKNLKDYILLLKPLNKKQKWDTERLKKYLSDEDIKLVKKRIKQNKVRIKLSKLEFSFLISGNDILPSFISDEEELKEINKRIEAKFYSELFTEFSSRAYDVLFHYLASETMDLPTLKRASILQLFSKFPLHILLVGETNSGKSKILRSVRKLAPVSSYGLGSSLSSSGLTLVVRKDKIEKGILPEADGGISCISEFEEINNKDVSKILSSMGNGFIKYDKRGKHLKINSKANVLASSEPKRGNFKSYSVSQIKKQIPFTPSVISKFHFIFILKKPDKKQFRKIADKIITESVKKEISDDELEFIKRYIKVASSKEVKIPKQISKQIEKMVKGLKEMDTNFPYELNSKNVEGIVQFVKASARCELRDKVESKDLDRVFSIVRKSLQI